MNKPHNSFRVDEYKIQASILLKSLHATNHAVAQKAARRFQNLPEFKNFSLEEIIRADMKRKHALTVIAIGIGFKSWRDLKCQLPFIRGGFLNHWFSHYAEAKLHQRTQGGFLLPFKNQFFVCDADYIRNLGFNPEDRDWTFIGNDWVHPESKEAWQRLYKKWMVIQQ
ncbi:MULTISPECIES: hypothetical protein [Legionella]|uniref:hypothetical protein n=1 Tax=Legionella TaxID=445 RepID=UPI000964111F|nr:MULTISPECIES: hypothetical protein [Legionella]MBN9227245.1 hypothetical protein [Legionella steelei]OJW14047.1 MAG: hypothetical protein BGO44_08845 [Legionella sp. 39-23]